MQRMGLGLNKKFQILVICTCVQHQHTEILGIHE